MILHPGGLVGLPAGVPSVTYDLAWWRDLLALVALAAGLSEARARRGAALGFALAYGVLGVAFWVAALGRPYGVLIDPDATRWAADVSVAGWAGDSERFLAGEPGSAHLWTFLARHLRPDLVTLIPTLLPMLVLPAAALAIAWLWGRPEAGLAAILWMGGATSTLDALRGTGFLTGLWSRPLASLSWIAVVAAVFIVARLPLSRRAAVAIGVLVVSSWAAVGRHGPALGLVDALLALTLDNHVWLLLGAAGLQRRRDPAACALITGGALLVLAHALGGPGDAWAGAAFFRIGLVLAATEWIMAKAPALAPARVSERIARTLARFGVAVERLPQASIVVLVLAGGLLAWWDPPRTDPVAKESLEPVPEALAEAMEWLRTHTPPQAAVLAAESYAGAVPILGGRRVLRAPGLLTAPDEERRLRLQRAVLAGHPPPALLQRYGLRYLFIALGDFRDEGVAHPEDLDALGTLRLVYANAKGMRVYEIVAQEIRPAAAGRAAAIK